MPPSNSTHYEFYLSVLFQKTMGVTGASLSLCVFLCLMPVCPADNLTASDMSTTISTATNGTSQTAIFDEKDKCLIDNQTGWIAIGSAVGLIVFLLVAVVTLACQVSEKVKNKLKQKYLTQQ